MLEFRRKQLLRCYKNCLHPITSQTTVKLIAVEKMTSSRYSIRMAREALLNQSQNNWANVLNLRKESY